MPSVNQAGAVAVRGRGAAARVLVVRAKKNPKHWIFPKGHVEKGERLAETALRELREEGGVEAKLVKLLGVTTFDAGDDRVKVSYFLVRFKRTVPSTEARERRWRTFRAASKLLTFDDARALVEKAKRLVGEGA